MHHSGSLLARPLPKLVSCLHSILKEMLVENNVLFDGTSLLDLNYFLFYSNNIAKAVSSNVNRAKSLIGYLCGRAFQFYYQRFAKNGEMNKEAGFNVVFKATSR